MTSLFDDAARRAALARLAPHRDAPWWRTPGGERTSLPAVRAASAPEHRAELDDEHAAAIHRIVRAALRAQEGGDAREARRLAQAAARLCQETVGLWATPALLADR
jgi:hypothetical protein